MSNKTVVELRHPRREGWHRETVAEDEGEIEAWRIFETQIGATGVPTQRSIAGNRPFLKFVIGREAPLYQHALRETKRSVSEDNPFRGTLGLLVHKVNLGFPSRLRLPRFSPC
jgi:hypothetical protein